MSRPSRAGPPASLWVWTRRLACYGERFGPRSSQRWSRRSTHVSESDLVVRKVSFFLEGVPTINLEICAERDQATKLLWNFPAVT
eukprot:9482504-Pyramimonas_sp.AAC.1